MKTFKDIALVGVCVALVAGIAFFGWSFFSGKFDEFNAVAKPIIVDVADSGWSNEAVGRHASPALKRLLDDPAHKDALAALRPLGRLKAYQGVQSFKQNTGGGTTTASLDAEAEFEHGKANVSMTLSWIKDGWNLDSFHAKTIP